MSRVAKMIEEGFLVGKVVVLRGVHNDRRNEWEYECRCLVCGKEFVCRRDHLLKPRSGCRSCVAKENGKAGKRKVVGVKNAEKK